jgi:two-component system NarL family sensor kinase
VLTRYRDARCAIAGAAVLLALSATWLALRAWMPGDGAPWRQDQGFTGGVTLDAGYGSKGSALRAGDVVIAVDGVSLDRWLAHSSPPRPPLAAGTALTYRVRRRGVVLNVPVRLAGSDPIWARLRHQGAIGLAAAALVLLGGFTVRQRPDHPSAHALLLLGAGLAAGFTFTTVGWEVAHLVTTPWLLALGMAGAVPGFTVMAAALAHLALTFPSPPLFLARRGWLIGLLYGTGLAVNLGAVMVYLLAGHATVGGLQRWYDASGVVLSALILLALAGLARTALLALRSTMVREQMRLVGSALGVTVLGVIILNALAAGTPASPWLLAALFLPLPIAVAAALLRGEFLDVRATLNRALVFVVTTALLLGSYAGIVALIGAAASSTGIAATLPATAVVAVAFAPLRSRVQRGVGRLLYGDRGQPAHVLAALGRRLEAALPPDEILPTIADTIAITLRLPYVALRIAGQDEALACERGQPPAQPDCVGLVHQGETVGEVIVGARSGEHGLSTADRALLTELAPHLAATVKAAALITELASSRTRLAVTREEERARLRHDLHDRLGSRLAGVALQLDAAATSAQGTPLTDSLRRTCDEVDTALNEVRRLTRGLRPADLDELGLIAAVRAAAARLTVADQPSGWQSDVSAAIHLPALAPEVEAAAYQIALEAMTNAYRHSGGHHAQVRIGVDPAGTRLVIEVTDDGHGLRERDGTGVGLRSMRERADAVGGSLEIRAAATGGALVRAELPIS